MDCLHSYGRICIILFGKGVFLCPSQKLYPLFNLKQRLNDGAASTNVCHLIQVAVHISAFFELQSKQSCT